MIKTPEQFELEQRANAIAMQLAQLPREVRVNLCGQVLMNMLGEQQAKEQKQLGSAAHLTLSQNTPFGSTPVATVFAFVGPAAPDINMFLHNLLEDIKTKEAELAQQAQPLEPTPVGLRIVEG